MTPQQPLTRANIESVVVSNHADAVLTSAVVTLQVGSQKGQHPRYGSNDLLSGDRRRIRYG